MPRANNNVQVSGRSERWVLIFALILPTIITWIYFVAMANAASFVQQSVYLVGKCFQFLLPVVWVYGLAGDRSPASEFADTQSRPVPTTTDEPNAQRGNVFTDWVAAHGVRAGILFGILVFCLALLTYVIVLKPLGAFDGPAQHIREKVKGLGLDARWKYAALLVFYALGHSWLEEYYWRWFVFRRLRERLGLAWANMVASLGFMAHHVIILATYFGWGSPLTYFFSLSVGVGGLVWAWLYSQSRSLIGPWLSHALVDAAIFAIGYDLVRDIFDK